MGKIKKGSVIREYKYGVYVESTVITDPIENERGQLEFTSITKKGNKINYMKHESSLVLICSGFKKTTQDDGLSTKAD